MPPSPSQHGVPGHEAQAAPPNLPAAATASMSQGNGSYSEAEQLLQQPSQSPPSLQSAMEAAATTLVSMHTPVPQDASSHQFGEPPIAAGPFSLYFGQNPDDYSSYNHQLYDDHDMSDSDGGGVPVGPAAATGNVITPNQQPDFSIESRPETPVDHHPASFSLAAAAPPPTGPELPSLHLAPQHHPQHHWPPPIQYGAPVGSDAVGGPGGPFEAGFHPPYHADFVPHQHTVVGAPAQSMNPNDLFLSPLITHFQSVFAGPGPGPPPPPQAGPANDIEVEWEAGMTVPLSNPHPNSLGPENLGLVHFLKYWAWTSRFAHLRRSRAPWLAPINEQAEADLTKVLYDDLRGDGHDVQGLDWKNMGITRRDARERRRLTYKNYTSKPGSDSWQLPFPNVARFRPDSFFKFRRMDLRRDVHLAHFQLRNVLACSGQNHAFYPTQRTIHRINPLSGQTNVAMDLSDIPNVQISTLDANMGILIAGTFNGEYCMRNVYSEDKKYAEGQITSNSSGITNHIQIHESRSSGSPLAAFASNDQGFRIIDLTTETFILETEYAFPLNCSALSTDRRLRVVVGDSTDVLVVSADTGEVLQTLAGHRDYGFACDWSDDGWTFATGAQDKGVKIWDARRLTNSYGGATPVTTIRSKLAGVRSLRFSPAGSGPRVLVAAEEADYVNIIDAQTFDRKQTFDIFGEIGGLAFTNGGQDLNVLCMDRNRGGLIQLERCNYGSKGSAPMEEAGTWPEAPAWRRRHLEPFESANFQTSNAMRKGDTQRTRVYVDEMEPF